MVKKKNNNLGHVSGSMVIFVAILLSLNFVSAVDVQDVNKGEYVSDLGKNDNCFEQWNRDARTITTLSIICTLEGFLILFLIIALVCNFKKKNRYKRSC